MEFRIDFEQKEEFQFQEGGDTEIQKKKKSNKPHYEAVQSGHLA